MQIHPIRVIKRPPLSHNQMSISKSRLVSDNSQTNVPLSQWHYKIVCGDHCLYIHSVHSMIINETLSFNLSKS